MSGSHRDPAPPPTGGYQAYLGLRGQVLSLDPASVGLAATPERPVLWGGLVDLGFPNGTATLAALADGTTSLYLSTGGGILGGGFHPAVAAATRSFLACLDEHLPALGPDPDPGLPGEGQVLIRALTYQGRRSGGGAEDDLGEGRHPLSLVFHAAHAVITQLRLIEEARNAP